MSRLFTIKELQAAAAAVSASYEIDISDARRIVGYYNAGANKDLETVAAMIAGDVSAVPVAAAALKIELPQVSGLPKNSIPVTKNDVRSKKNSSDSPTVESVNTKKTDGRKKKKRPTEGGADHIEVIKGDVIPAGMAAAGLPDGIMDKIEGWLSDFSQRYDIDLVKASGQQWRSACIYIGQHIQKSGILEDREREKKEGGKIYNAAAVAALLPLWEYVTGLYKHVPLASDFISFSGVSRGWFYDSDGRGLTSASIQIAKKARQIEEAGIAAALTDGRENPTGRIYYSKARLGWQETTVIQHVSAAAAPSAPVLPVFDGSAGFLTDSGTDSAENG